MPAADALAGFLRALGVPGQEIPPEEDERAARYRSLLAGRRVLIVLDNAGSVDQVRPLLPGNSACAVVVTSRDSLAGLVARDGAAGLDLDLLPPAEAISLLRALIGRRVDDDPDAAETLAGQCCRLPLALRVAAELAASRRTTPLADLAGELADQQRRLDLLDAGGDPRTAVRAVFSWSYRRLGADAARAFRLTGLHPGPDFEPYAVGALTGMALEQARRALDALARAHLIQPTAPGRYGLHDLLRGYARKLAAQDGEQEQRTALTRLFDYYQHVAATAMAALYPAPSGDWPAVAVPTTAAPPLTEPGMAQGWLDAERKSLVAVTVHTAEQGWWAHATGLAAILFRYLDTGSHYPEAVIVYDHARSAACHADDRAAEALALDHLAAVYWRQVRYQEATDYVEQALELSRESGDRAGQARALGNLGLLHFELGRYRQAADLMRQSLDINRETSNWHGQLTTLINLGLVEQRLGRYEQAARHHEQSLVLAREVGDRAYESCALGNLGAYRLRQGRLGQAARLLQSSLVLSREIGNRNVEAVALARLGEVRSRLGHFQQAVDRLQQSLAVACAAGNRDDEADALNTLGEVFLAAGRPRDARDRLGAALELATETGLEYEQARAHDGLGHAYRVTGDAAEAHRHWQQALSIFAELGVPEADQVRAQLATAETEPPLVR
jgi:tetratricopeptide (TPR) repeat protein